MSKQNENTNQLHIAYGLVSIVFALLEKAPDSIELISPNRGSKRTFDKSEVSNDSSLFVGKIADIDGDILATKDGIRLSGTIGYDTFEFVVNGSTTRVLSQKDSSEYTIEKSGNTYTIIFSDYSRAEFEVY